MMSSSGKRGRPDSDEDALSHAIALSLADTDSEARVWAAAKAQADAASSLALDHAIAVSISDADESAAKHSWDCAKCTLTNENASGRCAACGADRAAPFSAAGSRAPLATSEWRCGLPGCVRPRAHFDFCTPEHQRKAAMRGLLPTQSAGEERVFLGASGDFAVALLTNQAAERATVIEQFRHAWRKPTPCPRVERVYAVRPSPQLTERHERYAAAVGNSRRRFHGTGAQCDFGIDDRCAPCASADCALCGILSRGFALRTVGSGPNAAIGRASFGTASGLRYGRGLYFSSTSGKSNDYAAGSERVRGRGRRWRTLFCARVAAGRAYCTDAAEIDLPDRPPDGFDSVVGEVGAHLNYDELVVYNEAAALPEFLLVVSFDP